MSYQSRLAALAQRPALREEEVEAVNRRWANRKPASTPAQIRFEGTNMPFDCMLRDISSTGAKLEMVKSRYNSDASCDAIPNHFTLVIQLDRIAVDCVSMWRRGSKIGVKFSGAVRQLPAPPKPAARKAK
jgi:hypothetical protein